MPCRACRAIHCISTQHMVSPVFPQSSHPGLVGLMLVCKSYTRCAVTLSSLNLSFAHACTSDPVPQNVSRVKLPHPYTTWTETDMQLCAEDFHVAELVLVVLACCYANDAACASNTHFQARMTCTVYKQLSNAEHAIQPSRPERPGRAQLIRRFESL